MLILPAEPAYPGRAVRLGYRDTDNEATYGAAGFGGLTVRDLNQRGVVDGFDKAVAQHISRSPECANILRAGHSLLNVGLLEVVRASGRVGHHARAYGPVVDQRAVSDRGAFADSDAGSHQITVFVRLARPQLPHHP